LPLWITASPSRLSYHFKPAIAPWVTAALQSPINMTQYTGQTRRVPVELDTIAELRETEQRHRWEMGLDHYRRRLVLGVDPIDRDRRLERHIESDDVQQRLYHGCDLARPGRRPDHQPDFALLQEQRRSTASYWPLPWRDRIPMPWYRIEHAHMAVVLEAEP